MGPRAWKSLRVGTHNVRGLCAPAAATQAAAAWQALGLDVVCVQETKWPRGGKAAAREALEKAGWAVFSTEAPQQLSGGVAIAINARCLATNGGPLAVSGAAHGSAALAGRILHLRAEWGGQRLHVASVYLESADPAAQAHAIKNVLGPLAARQHGDGWECVWGGDWNFCHARGGVSPTTTPVGLESSGAAGGPGRPARAWDGPLGPRLVDIFRAKYPLRRAYTHFHRSGASRLDRVYVSGNLAPSVTRAAVADARAGSRTAAAASGLSTSDHRPAFIDVAAKEPVIVNQPARRARLDFHRSRPHWDAFLGTIERLAAAAPADHASLLQWWPTFKARAAAAAGAATTAWRASQRGAAPAQLENLQDLYVAAEHGTATAAQVLEAARQTAAAAEADDHSRHLREKRDWIHARERPHPTLTRRLQRPRATAHIAELRAPSGQMVRRPPALAELVAKHWAAVSAKPRTHPGSRRMVLRSLRSTNSPQLTEECRDQISETTVMEGEVAKALQRMKGGTSPGLDGLPLEFYRQCGTLLNPLLARLFTAAWVTNSLPPRFNEGLITVLFKSGEPHVPSNYRPITLLGTDYRIFAKILANRLRTVLSPIVDREQTAFLPDRCIGDNILCLQLLPHSLLSERRSALIAFCDFQKAYDTVDRNFLFSVMRCLGVDGPFLAMVQTLLSNTISRARVNGCLSNAYRSYAGVRQGCPLAPLLYLFIGQALLRFLSDAGFGISIPGRASPLTALQFADDTKVLLNSADNVDYFISAMELFGEASGQLLHKAKTKLLPVGAPPPTSLPPTIAGLSVVNEATALGITFRSGTQPPTTDWDAHLQQVDNCLRRARSLRLSAMGRGLASATYGVGQLLYHAEFLDPPEEISTKLQLMTRAFVLNENGGGGQSSAAAAGSSSGSRGERRQGARLLCRPQLLGGSPGAGGWGVLPWTQHVQARRCRWVGKLIGPTSAAGAPWVGLARGFLWGWPRAGEAWPTALAGLPPPLRRMVAAVAQLPPPTADPLAAAPGMAAQLAAGTPVEFLVREGATPLRRAGVHTVGQLLHEIALLDNPGQQAGSRAGPITRHWRTACEAAVAALPAGWREGASAVLTGSAAPSDWLAAIQHLAAWDGAASGSMRIWQLSVKAATRLQLSAVEAERREKWRTFAAEIGGGVSVNEVAAVFGRAWRLPVANAAKEVLWALTYDAYMTPQRLHQVDPCVCGTHGPGRRHYFWDCPIACAIVCEMQRFLPSGAGRLSCRHLWLLDPPPTQAADPWAVVALSFLSCLEHVRRAAVRRSLSPTPQPPPTVEGASRRAIAHFWAGIAKFCSLNIAPASWQTQPCSFFAWKQDSRGTGHWSPCYPTPSPSP